MKNVLAQLIGMFRTKLATVDTVMEAHRSTIDNLKAVVTAHTAKADEHAAFIAQHTADKAAATAEAVRASKIAAKMEAIFE